MKVDIDVTVECDRCGKELRADWYENTLRLCVEPCKGCLEEENDKGYKEGRMEGA